MPVQRVTALIVPFRQEATTVLAPVALDMEVTIQGNNAYGLLLSWGRHDGLLTHRTPRGKFLMEILDAVDVATSIHSEGDPIQAAMAHHTGEAVGMVGLPSGPEDPFHDGLCTDTALLQCILQVFLWKSYCWLLHMQHESSKHCPASSARAAKESCWKSGPGEKQQWKAAISEAHY